MCAVFQAEGWVALAGRFAGALITPEQSALLAGRGVNLDGVWIAYNPAEAERWRRLFRPEDGGQGPAGGDGLVTGEPNR